MADPDLALKSGSATLCELPRAGMIILRGDPGEDGFTRAVRGALTLDLPLVANTASQGAALSALWLGPDEWLLLCADGSEMAVIASLRTALSGRHAAIVDISDARCVAHLSGAAARDVLARGCAVDFHPRAFTLGAVAQTRLAQAEVIVHRCTEDGFDIYVARSFADHLWRWLADAIALG
jgi:sarcosine oxidase subunit gamma